jgi:SAM-dependent methyltransferase
MSPSDGFADHFSAEAAGYAAFRPTYPPELFALLADLCRRNDVAWDCATGNGQAAVGLAEHFARVVATDASERQIAEARAHPRVEYRVTPAERSGLEAQSVELVTVAQALHWFRLDPFYAEVRRVLRPQGLLAAWCYATLTLDDARIESTVARFYEETVGPYWPPERRLVEEGYRSLPFPFAEISLPPLAVEADLDLGAFLGYVRTWSAVQRCRQALRADPMPAFAAELGVLWGAPERKRRVRWPLFVRAGRHEC